MDPLEPPRERSSGALLTGELWGNLGTIAGGAR